VRDNDANGNCIGVYVDPAVTGAVISGNRIGPSNSKCAGPGSFGVYGIILDSAIKSKVEGNTITGQRNAGQGVGIAIVDEKCTEPSLACVILGNHAPPASGNVVAHNILRNNDINLLINTTGKNVVLDNK
jgi:nitrous oxidase accessory protein NosD